MRIGIYDPYLDDLGGGEKYMMTIARNLSRENDVDIFWDNSKDLDKISKRFTLNLEKIHIVKNIFNKVTDLRVRLKESIKYDAIIVLSDGSLPLLLSKKVFVHFQQPFPKITPNLSNKVKSLKINSYICNSKFTKSYIDKEFNINSKVLYPPVEIFAKEMKKENIILNVGRFRIINFDKTNNIINDFKKQGKMIDCFKNLIDKGLKSWKLVIAISINDSEKILFEKLKLKTQNYPIEFLINKSNTELWDVYSKSKIYWHASGFNENLDSHPELAEHFGISTVEAMGAGVVPVVINAGGQKEIVTNGEDGFLWNTLEDLESKTKQLINDQALLDEMAQKAKLTALKFSGDTFEKELIKIIN